MLWYPCSFAWLSEQKRWNTKGLKNVNFRIYSAARRLHVYYFMYLNFAAGNEFVFFVFPAKKRIALSFTSSTVTGLTAPQDLHHDNPKSSQTFRPSPHARRNRKILVFQVVSADKPNSHEMRVLFRGNRIRFA